MSAATPGQTPLDHVVARVSKLHPSRIDLTLDRMQRILARLDHPERRLPPVIHVAGTNGKGSTVAYLRSILEAADLKVHVYTSPYLVRLNECVRLAGTLVGDDALRDALLECERVNGGEPITESSLHAAMGMAQAAGEEAKAAFRSQADRIAAELDLVRREDFDALKAEIAALRAEVETLRAAQAAPKRKPSAAS